MWSWFNVKHQHPPNQTQRLAGRKALRQKALEDAPYAFAESREAESNQQ